MSRGRERERNTMLVNRSKSYLNQVLVIIFTVLKPGPALYDFCALHDTQFLTMWTIQLLCQSPQGSLEDQGDPESPSSHLSPIWALLIIYKHFLQCLLFLFFFCLSFISLMSFSWIPVIHAFLPLHIGQCSQTTLQRAWELLIGVPSERIHGINLRSAEYPSS